VSAACDHLDALSRREPRACAEWVDTHYAGVYRFFYWLTRDRDASADLTQETFLAFWESIPRLAGRGTADLKAWLYGIARNRWRKRSRLASHTPEPLDDALEQVDQQPGPDALLLQAWDAEQTAAAICKLPPDYREALVLRVFEELSYREVAAALGIGEGLARWRVHQARLRLQAALRELTEPEV